MEAVEFEGTAGTTIDTVSRMIAGAVSGALTGLFALAGAFTGAITGAVAGRASQYGALRGAGLGAIAGAVLSLEVLEASRAYWCLELSGSRGPSSMADFIEQLLPGRLDGQFMPPMFSYHWQTWKMLHRVGNVELNVGKSITLLTTALLQCTSVRIADISYGETEDIYGEVASRGLSGDSLKKLPCYIMSDEVLNRQIICCTICLQDIEAGEITRSLPRCHHTFHLVCLDKWLIRHGSCPVCRQSV